MQRTKKIINTIFIFIIIMLLICFLFAIYSLITNKIPINQLLNKTGLYFLYTIGYGALEGDALIQNILAIIGIVALALMSTFLTINLFWRLDDVFISKIIKYDNNNLNFIIQNTGRTICNLQINFMLYDTNIIESPKESKEYCIPMLVKKTSFHLKVDLNDTFWYKVVYNLLTNNSQKLYCLYSFVDTKNGQNSIKIEEFKKENIENLTYETFIKPHILDYKKLEPIENGGKIKADFKDNFYNVKYKLEMNKKKENNFVMLYYNFHNNLLNLEKYNKDTTYIEFDIDTLKKFNLTLEIKTKENLTYSKEILIDKEKQNIKIDFSLINLNIENVNEICFTIFKNNNPSENSFTLSNLKICTK